MAEKIVRGYIHNIKVVINSNSKIITYYTFQKISISSMSWCTKSTNSFFSSGTVLDICMRVLPSNSITQTLTNHYSWDAITVLWLIVH